MTIRGSVAGRKNEVQFFFERRKTNLQNLLHLQMLSTTDFSTILNTTTIIRDMDLVLISIIYTVGIRLPGLYVAVS